MIDGIFTRKYFTEDEESRFVVGVAGRGVVMKVGVSVEC